MAPLSDRAPAGQISDTKSAREATLVHPQGGTNEVGRVRGWSIVNTEITLRKASDASGPAGRQLHLLVMSTDAFFSQPLPARGVVTVGRSSKCHVRVDDPLASREHAHIQIETVGDGAPVVSINDAGS